MPRDADIVVPLAWARLGKHIPVYLIGGTRDADHDRDMPDGYAPPCAREGTLRHRPRPHRFWRWWVALGSRLLPRLWMPEAGERCRKRTADWYWPFLRTGETWWRPVAGGSMMEFTHAEMLDRAKILRRPITEETIWAFNPDIYLARCEGRPLPPMDDDVRDALLNGDQPWRRKT